MEQYSKLQKRGCPTCGGIDPRSCVRCQGKTIMMDWFITNLGYTHISELSLLDFEKADKIQSHNKALKRDG